MTLLILGLVLWTVAHVFKAVAPARRAALTASLGEGPSKGLFAALIALSLVLMILGYRAAPIDPVWTPPAWGQHLNNLLMLFSVALFGAGSSKGKARSLLRHPQLTAVVVWAAAHLLVNGDAASLVLFGGIAIWALANMALINARDGAWVRPEPGPLKGDLRLAIIALVLYGIIAAIHTWLGYPVFPG